MESSDFESRLAAIEERNRRVETDKAWEGSITRRLSIALCTYAIVTAFLFAIDVAHPWINAVVPVIGYLLSTLTLPVIKSAWSRNRS